MRHAFIAALLLMLTATSAPGQSQPAAEALARSLQERYERIRDFSADFVHTYRGGVLRKEATERGTMAVKKPGKMRWNYTNPEKKLFVSDGVKVYSYIPQDRQVIVSNAPRGDDATTPAMFLAGKGDIVRDFTASYVDSPLAGAWALQLVPKRPEREYESLVLIVDPASLQIRGLRTQDRQGGLSTFTFANLKENRGLADKEFAFRIPRGVDVITDGSVSR